MAKDSSAKGAKRTRKQGGAEAETADDASQQPAAKRTAVVAQMAVKESPRATALGARFDTRLLMWFGIAALIGLMLYWPAMNGPFLLDDRYQMFGRPDAAQIGFGSWIASVRPFLNLTFWLNYQASGTDTASYHFVNVLLHAANSVLVFVVARALWRSSGGGETSRQWAPLAVAALFLLHPMQTESVAYVSSRSEVLSVLFAYAALAVQLTAPEGPLSLPRIGAMLAGVGMAVLTKEHTAAMPAVFLLADYFWRGGWRGVRENWRLHASMVVAGLAGLAFVVRTLGISTSAGFGLKEVTPLNYFATQCRMFWRYLRLLLLPVGQNVDPDIALSRTLADPAVLVGFAGIVGLIAAAWWLRRRAPLAAFGVLMFAILLAPTSSFVPILDVFAERRVYLPMIGICLLALEALRRWRIPVAACAGVLAILAYATFSRSTVWASEQALWRDSVAGSPEKYRPRFQLAYAEFAAGKCADASAEFGRAEKLMRAPMKPDVTLYTDWALSLDCENKQADAAAKLAQAEMVEDSAAVRASSAMVQAKLGHLDRALDELQHAQSLDAKFPITYVYRGNVFTLQGKSDEARAEFQHALALDPNNAAAAQALAAAK